MNIKTEVHKKIHTNIKYVYHIITNLHKIQIQTFKIKANTRQFNELNYQNIRKGTTIAIYIFIIVSLLFLKDL